MGGFARGTSLFGLGGALVLETSDEQASAQTLDDLRRTLSADRSVQSLAAFGAHGEQGFSLSPAGVPIQVQFVQRDGKVVVGLGSDSVDQVFSPSSTLGDSDAFKAAETRSATTFLRSHSSTSFRSCSSSRASRRSPRTPATSRPSPTSITSTSLACGGRSEGSRGSFRSCSGCATLPPPRTPARERAPRAVLVP